MQLKVNETRPALHPSEAVVVVQTSNGFETLVVDKRSISGSSIEIGQPLGHEKDNVLVELPRETYSGAWRVWVPQANVSLQTA